MGYLLFDNFTGTTIDTNRWDEYDAPAVISQNDALLIGNGTHTDRLDFNALLVSKTKVTSGVAVAQCNLTWTTDGNSESWGGMFLYKDANNYAFISSRSDAGGQYRLRIVTGGTERYAVTSGLTTKGKDVKIWTDGTDIKFYYWGGSSWTQMGTTQTYSLGYDLYIKFSAQDASTFNGANPITIDNAYLSGEDYTTQYPAATTTEKSLTVTASSSLSFSAARIFISSMALTATAAISMVYYSVVEEILAVTATAAVSLVKIINFCKTLSVTATSSLSIAKTLFLTLSTVANSVLLLAANKIVGLGFILGKRSNTNTIGGIAKKN